MRRYIYIISVIFVSLFAFLAGWQMRNRSDRYVPSISKNTGAPVAQNIPAQTTHGERGRIIGRQVYECQQNEAEINVEDYIPVNTSLTIHTAEYGDIDMWKLGGEESSLYASADDMYEFYYVPVNAYLRKDNEMLLTGCFSDAKRAQNLYGI